MGSRLRKSDLWGVQLTSGEAVNSFSNDFCSLSLSVQGRRQAPPQTQARSFDGSPAVDPRPSAPCPANKHRRGAAAFLSIPGIGAAGWAPGGELGLHHQRTSDSETRSALTPGRQPAPITATTAPCPVPASVSKLPDQRPHTHWKVGPGPAPGIRRVSQGLGGGGGWDAISPPAPLRLRVATATAG